LVGAQVDANGAYGSSDDIAWMEGTRGRPYRQQNIRQRIAAIPFLDFVFASPRLAVLPTVLASN